MKKIILLTLTTLILVGCSRYKRIDANIIEATGAVIIVDKHTLDSCEYYPHYGHKGNCRFCKERRQKELKELVEHLKEK